MEESQRRNAYHKPENYDDEIHALTKLMRQRLLEHDEKRGGKSWKVARGVEHLDPADLPSIAHGLLQKATDVLKSAYDLQFLFTPDLRMESTSGKTPEALRGIVMEGFERKAADVANYALILLDLSRELAKAKARELEQKAAAMDEE